MAHDGGDPRREFCQTLTLTCVASGWTELRALPKGAQRWVHEAPGEVRRSRQENRSVVRRQVGYLR